MASHYMYIFAPVKSSKIVLNLMFLRRNLMKLSGK